MHPLPPYRARITGGYWHTVPLTWSPDWSYLTLNSVSCAAAGTCVAACAYENTADTTEGALFTGSS